jgi:methylated-DNA-[protein]-cysteine S-methyltransferase
MTLTIDRLETPIGTLRLVCDDEGTLRALAAEIGRSAAVRAVGLANGANPVAIVVPCHRAIGADGSLTGYGGGLPRKRWLLAHEGVAAFRLGA